MINFIFVGSDPNISLVLDLLYCKDYGIHYILEFLKWSGLDLSNHTLRQTDQRTYTEEVWFGFKVLDIVSQDCFSSDCQRID